MPEQILECHTHDVRKNWYVSKPRVDLRVWSKSSDRTSMQVVKGFRSRRRYNWFRVRSARLVPLVEGLSRAEEARFKQLVEEWKRETRFASFSNQKFLISSYQRIIGLGPRVIPLILRELQNEPDHWFWALAALTGENPVRPELAGDVRRMTATWIQWGREQGYL